jgi:hypothetical protein
MAILVTGAFGCIGAWVVREFETPQRAGRLDTRELGSEES